MQRWTAFARQLDAPRCEALLTRAAARQLCAQRIERRTPAQATEGWNLASRGYVPHAVLMRRRPHRPLAPAGAASQVELPL
jgi:hypothetical protein